MKVITDKMIDQAYSDLRKTCAGVRNDYFGLLYLEKEFDVSQDKAINQVTFGGNDYGVDGFHFDKEKRNLYLFQFKYSDSYIQFKDSMQRLIDIGVNRIFSTPNVDNSKNQILLQLRSCMVENRSLIEQVCFRFVFTGDPKDAEQSKVLDKLREDLESKKYLIDDFFADKKVSFVVEFRSATGKIGSISDTKKTMEYKLNLKNMINKPGPNGECMYIGFIKLIDLIRMYKDMGQKFFERNIRYGLGSSEAVNRAISKSLKQIIFDQSDSPDIFAFNHNGITLFAEKIENNDECYIITSPRLLNGAQTITTFRQFLELNKDNKKLEENKHIVENITVLCKIITQASQEFVTRVTINNNRQNPVEPWNLHANDLIQLELQDKLKDDLGIYYERQENAFESINLEEEEGITEEGKAIQLVKLAQTFLITDGNISALANMRRIFEDDNVYNQTFNQSRLRSDTRQIVLCYKIQFRLRRLLQEIEEKGKNKYWFIYRARYLFWALLCQGMLNDPEINEIADEYGQDMSIQAQYTEYLLNIASTKCRPLISTLINDKLYADKVAEENLSFLRTNAAYAKCMEYAYKRWRWVEKKLK
ncbi:MAG: hypothetical protein A2252_09600 [Elusimicrobia bacterium RIFOXYA2_FULL_39_19]|nr:MAG: hypothetical protein A2252_09600 [Elusimicrobia bacterium RIFOXYA2_FULL_39_19]